MREAMIIVFDDDGKTLKVKWQYYGSLVTVGNIVTNPINVKHKNREHVVKMAEALKNIALEKSEHPTIVDVENVKIKTKEREPVVEKKEVKPKKKIEIRPRKK